MSQVCFLLDEHIPISIQKMLEKARPEIRVYRVGDGVAPPKNTPDEQLLAWIEQHECMLLTNNRATMPIHLAAHIARGGHIPGIVQMPRHPDIQVLLYDLVLIWAASVPGEFRDQIIYLPLSP